MHLAGNHQTVNCWHGRILSWSSHQTIARNRISIYTIVTILVHHIWKIASSHTAPILQSRNIKASELHGMGVLPYTWICQISSTITHPSSKHPKYPKNKQSIQNVSWSVRVYLTANGEYTLQLHHQPQCFSHSFLCYLLPNIPQHPVSLPPLSPLYQNLSNMPKITIMPCVPSIQVCMLAFSNNTHIIYTNKYK